MAYFKARVNGSSGNEPVLLWTNPNPTSNFAAQTINVDTSNYTALGLEILNHPTSPYNNKDYMIHTKDKGVKKGICTISTTATLSPANANTRLYNVIDDSSIQFSNGYYQGSAQANVCIPQRIWGYKKINNPT